MSPELFVVLIEDGDGLVFCDKATHSEPEAQARLERAIANEKFLADQYPERRIWIERYVPFDRAVSP